MIQTLSDALAERGYDALTPVQEAVTNPELNEADLLVSAQTGSGKTVGFGLAIGPTLLDESGRFGPASTPMALVIAPTRELAFQVKRELEWLYAKAGVRMASCVGGMDMRDERRALERGAHIVVGTPGRLRDHIQRGSLDMTGLRAIVLDEADEMLDLGFREDLEFMLGEAPEDRRTLLFSATVPPMIAKLATQYQRDAVRVTTVSERSQHADIAYQALRVAQNDAENAIINVLRYHEAENAIVFANTRATVNRLTARFANRGFSVVALSGELSQTERSHALQAMRDGRARVCVATDVAARGIDLPKLELVIHAELPSNPEGLLHRSGRTGRAGRKGISALIVPPRVAKKAERLLKMARVTAEWTTAPGAEEILRRDEERLLEDPTWSAEITEDEAAFASRLLAAQSPEAVAAAYLRLFRERHSAPEELSAPDARAEPRERKPFGPSAWIALSVGRDERAEARWLLPLLCRAGGLTKDDIGAIRVQQNETYVELTEKSVNNFLNALSDDGTLENDVKARRFEGTPDVGRPSGPSKGPYKGPSKGPRGGPGKGPGGPKHKPDGPRPPRDAGPRPAPAPKPAAQPAEAPAPRQAEAPTPAPKPKPAPKTTYHPDGPAQEKPRDKKGRVPKAASRSGDAVPKWKAKKSGGAEGAHGAARKRPSGPGGARGDSKPGGPRGDRPARPERPERKASDTSKRFTPPGGKGKGGPRKPRAGGGKGPKPGKR